MNMVGNLAETRNLFPAVASQHILKKSFIGVCSLMLAPRQYTQTDSSCPLYESAAYVVCKTSISAECAISLDVQKHVPWLCADKSVWAAVCVSSVTFYRGAEGGFGALGVHLIIGSSSHDHSPAWTSCSQSTNASRFVPNAFSCFWLCWEFVVCFYAKKRFWSGEWLFIVLTGSAGVQAATEGMNDKVKAICIYTLPLEC